MVGYWKIVKEKQGLWNPQIIFGIEVTDDEKEEIKKLNISTEFNVMVFMKEEYEIPDEVKSFEDDKKIILLLSGAFYDSEDARNCHKIGYTTSIGDVKCRLKDVSWNILNPLKFYLPWKSGRQPDYSDYIDPIKKFLRKAISKMYKRFDEAVESVSSSDWSKDVANFEGELYVVRW